MISNNIYRGRSIRKAFGILALILSLAGSAGAATWTVDDSGGANFTRIQDAIDNASAGDTILVYSGTYYENVKVTKQLILSGTDNGGGKPVVEAGGNDRAITLSADGVILEGFKAINAPYSYGSGTGIYVESNNNIIKNNTVSDNNYAGIFLASPSYYSDIINNTLSYNLVSNNGAGIYLYYSSNNVLIGNTANSNRGQGIVLWPSNNNTLSNNTVNTNGHGISLGYSSDNVIVGNTASNNPIGISLDFSSNNNLIYDNFFNNTNNFFSEDGATNNIWNITKTAGTNIIGGAWLGGNYWSDYAGKDLDGDGLGDTLLPYNSSGKITNGGDFLPLTAALTPTAGSISGFKVNDTNGNGKWDANENGISNWTIRLIGITGKGKDTRVIRKETFTDAMGFYKFDNLPAGRYFVIEKLKKGFAPTSSPVKRIKLAQDENSINNNFTNRPVQSLDKKDDKRDIDDYEVINRNIDKYKEDMEWN